MSAKQKIRSVKQNLGRRDFLRATLVTAGVMALPRCSSGTDREVQAGAAYFPQSVASGDPRPDSVIVWTRIDDSDTFAADEDVALELEVFADAELTQPVELDGATAISVMAAAKFDHCVKVKLRGLDPATTYYYRFVHTRDDGAFASPTGRTRTAPAADSDARVRFAFVSCQDFTGRYYHCYKHMVTMDLDFIVHLGDYIYETTGDPSFQTVDGRSIAFDDQASAITFNAGEANEYYAARSLDNYRQLYRTYRADAALQAVHANIPMVIIWDDHEFTDDSYGAVGTYFDARQDESDPDRRKAANQAWFEYMPVDYQDEDFEYDPSVAFPGDIQIYRDFTFGKHMRLVMTDLRSYRDDHLIAEDAFPGAVILTQAELMAELGSLPDAASAYIDIDTYAGGAYKTALVAAADQLDFEPSKVTGLQDVTYINSLVDKLSAPNVTPIVDLDDLERGFSYRHLGKLSPYASIGSRYLVVKDTFELWAKIHYQRSNGATQEKLGAAQEQWFLDTMTSASETWKIWGNEHCLVPLAIDLTFLPVQPFNFKYLMNVDHWDGMPDRRAKLLQAIGARDNVVAITGDIHAFYAGLPGAAEDRSQGIIEFVTSSISSGTFRTLLVRQVAADPILSSTAGASDLAGAIDELFSDGVNPHLAYADSTRNGFATVELDGTELITTYHKIAEDEVSIDPAGLSDEEIAAKFTTEKFRVEAGQRELYRDNNGTWQRWDPATNRYV